MLSRAPRALPALPLLLADLGNPSAARIGRALGVSERTAWRWLAAGDAPRPATLALYWLTSWGWSAIEADARNRVAMAEAMAAALARERDALQAENARLRACGDFGCANDTSAWPIAQPRAGFRPQRSIGELRPAVGPELGFNADQPPLDAHDPPKVGAK
jgi:hypothetical protein